MTSDLIGAEDELAVARRKRWILIGGAIAALLIVAVIAFGMMSGKKDGAATAAGAAKGGSQVPVVTVIAPGKAAVTAQISATGNLAARRDIPVGVVGEGGQVSRVFVEANSWVRQGQVLASVERSVQVQQIAALDAQIGVARADLALAQNELERSEALVGRGFVSKADVDRKQATRDSAAARLRAAQAQSNEARARTARLDIRAPVSGVILERNVQVGQVVGAGSGTLFRMAEGGEMELRAQLSEDNLARIPAGTQAIVTPVGTTQQFTGRVWEVSPVIDPQTRQGIARIALRFDPALRPGGFASTTIASGQINAPLLPESAVQSDNDGNYVYIVGKDNKVARRGVTTGTVTAQGIAITQGLNGDERVVLRAGGFLNPGDTVKPQLTRQQN